MSWFSNLFGNKTEQQNTVNVPATYEMYGGGRYMNNDLDGGCQRGGSRSRARRCETLVSKKTRYRTDGWPMVSCVKYGELVQNKHTGHMGRLKVRNGRGIYIVDKRATAEMGINTSRKGSRKGSKKGSKKRSRKGSKKCQTTKRRSRSRSRSRSTSKKGDEWKSLLALKWYKQSKNKKSMQSAPLPGVPGRTLIVTPAPGSIPDPIIFDNNTIKFFDENKIPTGRPLPPLPPKGKVAPPPPPGKSIYGPFPQSQSNYGPLPPEGTVASPPPPSPIYGQLPPQRRAVINPYTDVPPGPTTTQSSRPTGQNLDFLKNVLTKRRAAINPYADVPSS